MPRSAALTSGNQSILFQGRELLSEFDRKWFDVAVAVGLSPDALAYIDKMNDRVFTVWSIRTVPGNFKLENAQVTSHTVEHYRGKNQGEYYRVRANPNGRWETVIQNPISLEYERRLP